MSAVASLVLMSGLASTSWQLNCRVMSPILPDVEKTGSVILDVKTIENDYYIEIISSDFPEFVAERQMLLRGSVTDGEYDDNTNDDTNVWIVQTASGRRAIEAISHWSRNGEGIAILISSYEMTTLGSLPEDTFGYHAAGLCRRVEGVAP